VLLIFFTAYGLLVIVAGQLYFRRANREMSASMEEAQATHQKFLAQKQDMGGEKEKLSNEAAEVFTLYALTRELSRNFNEREAFEIFKQKLAENVRYDECRIVAASSPEVQALRPTENDYVVELRVHKELLGYLGLKGCPEGDHDKVSILARQFAVSLRRDRLYQEVERLAITDSLTGVQTRRYFLSRLDEEVKRASRRKSCVSFLMVDVDFFKHLNDQYGHLTGDQILRRIVEFIKENVREIDFVGRYGGEEFGVVLPDTDIKSAHHVAERIRMAVARTLIAAYDTKVHVTVSIGMAAFPQDAKDKDELIDKADWALYRAKKAGRNAVCAFGIYP